VTVPISLASNGVNLIIILPLRFDFDSDVLSFNSCTTPLAGFNPLGVLLGAGQVSAGLTSNTNAIIPDGVVLNCSFTIAAGASPGASALTFVSAGLSDDQFNDVIATGTNGEVTIQ
jgi:hypothetical protein